MPTHAQKQAVNFYGETSPIFFGNFTRALFTLFQVCTGDGWASGVCVCVCVLARLCVCACVWCKTGGGTERVRDRNRDRKGDKQTERERKAERQTSTETDREKETESARDSESYLLYQKSCLLYQMQCAPSTRVSVREILLACGWSLPLVETDIARPLNPTP